MHAPAGAGNSLWGSGFLPTVYQGVQFRSGGDPVLFLSNPPGVDGRDRRQVLDALQELNRLQLADVGDPEIATRISQYELAFRMQTAVPELTDLSREPRRILEMYGATPGQPSFANHCSSARGWSYAASLFRASFTTPIGTIMPACSRRCRANVGRWTNRWPPWCAI